VEDEMKNGPALRKKFVFGLIAMLLILAACAPAAPAQPTESTGPQPTTEVAQPEPTKETVSQPEPTKEVAPTETMAPEVAPAKDTLTVAINGQPSRLQPQQPVGRLNEIVNALIFDALTTRDQEGNLVPALAESWNLIDETTWEFKLRPGLTFHNGDPVTSEDVKFTYEQLVLNPDANSPHKTFLQTIQEVVVIDDTTFQIKTSIPDVLLPSRVFDLYGSIVPKNYYEQVGDAEFDNAPIGTGPYKFVDWVKDSHMTLEANENYWGQKPAYKTLILRFITDDAARMAAELAGEVDIASNVPPARVEEIDAADNVEIRSAPSSRFYFVVMDTTKPPFDDPRVRKAVNLAIDREALVLGVGRGYGTPIASVFIPQTFGYDPNIQPVYDPEQAKALLADAGYPDGFDVVFDSFTGSIVDHSKVAEAIVAQLNDVGIRATLNVAEYGVFGPIRLAKETNPMYIYSLGDWAFDMGVHLKSYLEGSQGYYYIDPELAAKVDAALGMFDEQERAAAYQEIQQEFFDKAPYGSVYQLEQLWAVAPGIDWNPQPDEMWRFNLASPSS
jgi:peptide/nickel transport system substrate-binding protein